MITFRETEQKIKVREAVFVDGEKVGEVWRTILGFQCCLGEGPAFPGMPGVSLHGSGETKKEAISDAILYGKKQARDYESAVAWFEMRI